MLDSTPMAIYKRIQRFKKDFNICPEIRWFKGLYNERGLIFENFTPRKDDLLKVLVICSMRHDG